MSGNINANANIKSISDKIKTETTTHIHTYTQMAHMTLFFSKVALRLNNLDGPAVDSGCMNCTKKKKKKKNEIHY